MRPDLLGHHFCHDLALNSGVSRPPRPWTVCGKGRLRSSKTRGQSHLVRHVPPCPAIPPAAPLAVRLGVPHVRG